MSPKIVTPEEQKKVRVCILDAARTLFVERGIEAVSMREIAKKIKYSATTIYNYFADKDALLQAICDEDFLTLANEMQAIMQLPNSIIRIQALCNQYAKFALSYPSHYRLMFMTPQKICNLETSQIQRGNAEQDAYALLKWVTKEAFDAQLFRADVDDYELIAQTLWASIHGVCSLEIAMGHDEWVAWVDLEKRIHLMHTSILRGLLAQPEKIDQL